MKNRDLKFEAFLRYKDIFDINTVYNIIKEMPDGCDDDIMQSIVDVIKDSRREALQEIKKLNPSKGEIKDIIEKGDKLIERFEKSIDSNNSSNDMDKKFDDLFEDKLEKSNNDSKAGLPVVTEKKRKVHNSEVKKWLKYYQKWISADDREFKEKEKAFYSEDDVEDNLFKTLIVDSDEAIIFDEVRKSRAIGRKETISTIRNVLENCHINIQKREITKRYLNDEKNSIKKGEKSYWFDYCSNLITCSNEELATKRKELGLNEEGGVIDTSKEVSEYIKIARDIFIIPTFIRETKIEISEEELNKIVNYILELATVEKFNACDDMVSYWYNYVKVWISESEFKYAIKKNMINRFETNSKIEKQEEHDIFLYVIVPIKKEQARIKERIKAILEARPKDKESVISNTYTGEIIFEYSNTMFNSVEIFDRKKDNVIITDEKKRNTYTLSENGLIELKKILANPLIYKMGEIKNIGMLGGQHSFFIFRDGEKMKTLEIENYSTRREKNVRFVHSIYNSIKKLLKRELNIKLKE